MKKAAVVLLFVASTASADHGPRSNATEIGQLEGTTWTKVPPLPRAHASDALVIRGAHVLPDGTQFLAGYTRPDGSDTDTGAIYRKDPGGAWKAVYTKPEERFGAPFGPSASDIYVAGIKLLVHWDGKTWSEVVIPNIKGDVVSGWADGKQLFVVTTTDWQTNKSWIYLRDETGTWSVDHAMKGILNTIGGPSDALYAVGNADVVLHRTKRGTWRKETSHGQGQGMYVYVASASDLYSAGVVLMHSRGDGKWAPVKLPTTDQVLNVWGRSSNDVFVGTMRDLLHFDGHAWSKTGWTLNVGALAGNAKTVLVTNIVLD